MLKNFNATIFNPLILASVYKIKKKILIFKKYAYNLVSNDSNLFAYYIQTKILIISIISLDFLRHQSNTVI